MDFLIAIPTNTYEHFTNNLSSQQSSKESGSEGEVEVKDHISLWYSTEAYCV